MSLSPTLSQLPAVSAEQQDLKLRSPTLLAPRTGFVEDNFSMDQGRGWFGDD